MKIPSKKTTIQVENSREVLKLVLNKFVSELTGKEAQWLPEYEEIAEWLSDNKGKGLFLFGHCGRGKSILSRYVLPAIILKTCRKVVSVFDVQEMNKDIDSVLECETISLDDIGTEDITVKFGERRFAFPEIIDNVEKQGKIIIVSTNLTADEISAKYGDRVLDRIKATTKRVKFSGNSLRE